MRKKWGIFTGIVMIVVMLLIVNINADDSDEAFEGTFVLLHGIFGDQAVWDGLQPDKGVAHLLRNKGYRVVTVTYPGLGRNFRQANESIDLKTHIQYVIDVLEKDNIKDATLVCHSYAGLICSALQDLVTERIRKMVFFDAIVPESGETFFSSIGMPSPDIFPDLPTFYKTLGIPVPVENLWCFPNLPPEIFGLTDKDEMAWLEKRQHCQPIGTLDYPVEFQWNQQVKKYFLHAAIPWHFYNEFLVFKKRAIDMGWNLYSFDESHYISISDPEKFLEALMWVEQTPNGLNHRFVQ